MTTAEREQQRTEKLARSREIGKRVRNLRNRRMISQRELGREVGMYQAHVSRLEQGGKYLPDILTLEKIARALDVPVSELMGGR